jgi:hypothetical protein
LSAVAAERLRARGELRRRRLSPTWETERAEQGKRGESRESSGLVLVSLGISSVKMTL